MNDKHDNARPEGAAEVILLEDLAPRKDVKGGSGQVVFGEGLDATWETGAGSEGFDASLVKRTRRRPE